MIKGEDSVSKDNYWEILQWKVEEKCGSWGTWDLETLFYLKCEVLEYWVLNNANFFKKELLRIGENCESWNNARGN